MMTDIPSIQELLDTQIPLIKAMGIKIEHFEEGEVETTMPFVPENLNHVGTIYAGALFSHAEVTAGVTLFSKYSPMEFMLLIKRVEIDYLKKATENVIGKAALPTDVIEQAEKDFAEKGKTAQMFPVELFCGDLKVAEAKVTFYLRKIEQG